MGYDIGTEVLFTATFKQIDGTLTDPTTVTCKVAAPSGTETTCTATKSSTGVYTAPFTILEAGTHYCFWQGTGALVASEEVEFFVDKSHVS